MTDRDNALFEPDELALCQSLLNDFNKEFNAWNRLKKEFVIVEKEIKAKDIDPFIFYKLLKKHSSFFKTKVFLSEPDRLDYLLERLNVNCRRYLRNYQENFSREIKNKGLRISGQYPKFAVEGFMEVEIDEQTFSVRVSGEKVETAFIPKIVQKLEETYRQLWKRDFDPAKFLQNLWKSYKITTSSRNRSLGDQAPILEIYPQMILLLQNKRFFGGVPMAHVIRKYEICGESQLLTGGSSHATSSAPSRGFVLSESCLLAFRPGRR